ncbi:MAG: PASTA domain-containing protein [Candidatus Cardinium sp.]|nr:PASTA domain-containing protein [Candidatus Cardinium sp.]
MRQIGKHLLYICLLSITLLYTFFYIILPKFTQQGKTVKVPDLTGMPVEALDDFVHQKRLRYAITDHNDYSSKLPPLTVLQQFPLAGALVKEGRKIYVTLNASHPPSTAMPNLVEASVKQAQLLLKNQGLKLGEIKYVPDITKNTVLEQWHNGHPIAAGQPIHKGSTIDLVAGGGLGKQQVTLPDVVTLPLEEASLLLLEQGIRTGIVHTVQKNSSTKEAIGCIIAQNPTAGSKVPKGTTINLWVVGINAKCKAK